MSMTEFDDLTKRILDRLDTFEEKIEKLCERLMKVEYELSTHFKEQEEKKPIEQISWAEFKNKKNC